MAATSHDFWLANLTAPVWKSLHMLVYGAYALLVLHITFGVLQAEIHPVYGLVMAISMGVVFGLHVLAALREAPADRAHVGQEVEEGFIDACSVREIPDNAPGSSVCPVNGWPYSNTMQNFRGFQCLPTPERPLGEGKIVNGCITCPWHGYQYLPETGRHRLPLWKKSPRSMCVCVMSCIRASKPNPAGTRVEPASLTHENPDEFYIGWEAKAAPGIGSLARKTVMGMLLVTVLVATVLAVAQRMIGVSAFEWGPIKHLAASCVCNPMRICSCAARKNSRLAPILDLLSGRTLEIWLKRRGNRSFDGLW